MTAQQTIIDRSIPEPMSGCWLWEGSRYPNGYGQAWSVVNQQSVGSHRLAWESFYGDIPEGLHVLHKCDNRACVNPNHLFLGTHLDNMRDRGNKGRAFRPKGELQGSHVLTEDKVKMIINEPSPLTVKRAKEMGIEHGVGSQHIYRIRRAGRWSHVSGLQKAASI